MARQSRRQVDGWRTLVALTKVLGYIGPRHIYVEKTCKTLTDNGVE